MDKTEVELVRIRRILGVMFLLLLIWFLLWIATLFWHIWWRHLSTIIRIHGLVIFLNKEKLWNCRFGGGKVTKKQLVIVGIAVLLLTVGLSGCNEIKNKHPIAIIDANTTEGNSPLNVNFSCIAYDYDGKIVNYWWKINGDFINERNTSYTFENSGKYLVTLYVEDDDGNKGVDTLEILVNKSNYIDFSNQAEINYELLVKDLDYLTSYLEENYYNLYHTITKEQFYIEISKIKENASDFDKYRFYIELSKLISKIGDGHTSISSNLPFNYFPLYIYEFSDGYHVLEIDNNFKHLLGTKLVAIGDKPVNVVKEKISEIISTDNDFYLKHKLPDSIICADYLLHFKIMDELSFGRFTFEDSDGNHKIVRLSSKKRDANARFLLTKIQDEMNIQYPLSSQYKGNNYWYQYFEKDKTIYLQYNKCRNDPFLPIDIFTDEILVIVKEKEVDTIIFDIRYNSGGSSILIEPLIDGLSKSSKINEDGKIYVIIGRETFSSAILNAFYLKDKTNAIFIGEPSGGKPNHYGDTKYFKLPNTQFEICYSTKYFKMSANNEDALYPDIEASLTYNDFINGVDPVLEKIKNLEQKQL